MKKNNQVVDDELLAFIKKDNSKKTKSYRS
jgi:hypothetical protein